MPPRPINTSHRPWIKAGAAEQHAQSAALAGPRSPVNSHPSHNGHEASNQGGSDLVNVPLLSPTSIVTDSSSGAHRSSLVTTSTSNGGKGDNPYLFREISAAYDRNDAEEDDWLHEVKWKKNKAGKNVAKGVDQRATCWRSCRGIVNIFILLLIGGALLALFLAYPVLSFLLGGHHSKKGGFGLGGSNATGQVATFEDRLRVGLIDSDTPKSAYSIKSMYGSKTMNLVFSDEFNTDGRSFWPGDDPYWEAPDLHYWETGDYEWYSPSSVTTQDGALVITLSARPEHNLNFRSGLLSTWNKVCFTGGHVEVSVVLPGDGKAPGFWPAIWTMGNLGRAGYGASTQGLWPYVYDQCDVGTLPNQTYPESQGGGPPAALNTGWQHKSLSYLPGQRLSACTCKGEDHPGPWLENEQRYRGRSAPELDVFEVTSAEDFPRASLSLQAAPYDAGYEWKSDDGATWLDETTAVLNSYKGGKYQQAYSAVARLSPEIFELSSNRFGQFGLEWKPGSASDSYAAWSIDNGQVVWRVHPAALGPNPETEIGQREIPREPMYLLMNLALSSAFSTPNWETLQFPAHMKVDYVRVYQEAGLENVSCDPPDFPTKDYIDRHMEAYQDSNLTTWTEPKGNRAGYGAAFPRNRLVQKCDDSLLDSLLTKIS
ncbi:unnamed protein product [Sympodiomycopsis kandeliae]